MLALLIVVLTAIGWLFDWERAREQASIDAAVDGEIQALALTGLLDRYRALPRLWANDERTARWLRDGDTLALKEVLPSWTYQSGAYAVGVFDAAGEVLVWRDREAGRLCPGQLPPALAEQVRQGSLGRYHSQGPDGRPLYWFATGVRDAGFAGSVVALVDMAELQQQWVIANHPLAVVDSEGVVVLSNEPQWDGLSQTDILQQLTRGSVVHRQPLQVLGWTLLSIERVDVGRVWFVPALGLALGVIVWLGLGRVFRRQLQIIQAERLQMAAALRLERQVERRTRALRAEVEQRQQAQRQLEAAQAEREQTAKLAAIGQLSTTLSHEYNQPIATISTYAQNGRRLLELGRLGAVEKNLDLIVEQTQRMSMLSKTLLGFARRSDSVLTWVDWRQCAREAEVLLQPRLRRHSDWAVVGPPALVKADVIALTQVFLNLMTNALDALRDTPGSLGLEGAWRGGVFEITCWDTGAGVDPAVAESLFEPFATTKPMGSGLGLGLSLVNDLMHRFGGEVRCNANTPTGSRFTLSFPHAKDALTP